MKRFCGEGTKRRLLRGKLDRFLLRKFIRLRRKAKIIFVFARGF